MKPWPIGAKANWPKDEAALTETALEGLPDLSKQAMPSMSYILEVPKEIKGKPFDFEYVRL